MKFYQKVTSIGLLATGLFGTAGCEKGTYLTGTVLEENLAPEDNIYRAKLDTQRGIVLLKTCSGSYDYEARDLDMLINVGDKITVVNNSSGNNTRNHICIRPKHIVSVEPAKK